MVSKYKIPVTRKLIETLNDSEINFTIHQQQIN